MLFMASGVMAVPRFERFFREAASLDVDKDDLRRLNSFVFDRIYDLLVRAQAIAEANGRDVIEPWDLPIPKGLQERIHEFERLDEDVDLAPFLADLSARPQLDLAIADETAEEFPKVAGAFSLALARAFKLIDPKVVNPSSEHWERASELFELVT
jgi:hypothetical protein